ncbi:hypothetical protein [Streptomyces griseorubiginosus]|uniref:hypothetical protein n=1 Tax=Streptomyces griseorubiginosus TaxID=67304 RepID=UPI002E81CB89|nr:hypothetical protein [Streptomyces griseorubiginosus]WUB45310.1 hypothetical protein OHN19_18945 [Streptomyces griseorubiginosus]WUB53827.1 hypothetical protein OG942_18940 [Streptomyces griseorubiginosus]
MKAILFGVVLGVLLLWPAALNATAATIGACAQPAVLAFVLGVLARPALARRMRRWKP